MIRWKSLAVILLVLLVVIAGCGSSSTGGGPISVGGATPTPPPSLDATQTALCLGHTIGNFANLGEDSNDNIVVRILEDTFESVFEQSCLNTITTGLTLLQQQVNPDTYVYVGPVTEQNPQGVWDSTPLDIANCTSSPTSSAFYLGPPLWISVVDPTTQQDAIFQDANLPFPQTVAGDVATYLDSTYLLAAHEWFDRQLVSPPNYPTLQPDAYLELFLGPVTITFKTGVYEVYSGGQVTEGPAQWSFLWDISFPLNSSIWRWTYHASGAHASGLCTSQ